MRSGKDGGFPRGDSNLGRVLNTLIFAAEASRSTQPFPALKKLAFDAPQVNRQDQILNPPNDDHLSRIIGAN